MVDEFNLGNPLSQPAGAAGPRKKSRNLPESTGVKTGGATVFLFTQGNHLLSHVFRLVRRKGPEAGPWAGAGSTQRPGLRGQASASPTSLVDGNGAVTALTNNGQEMPAGLHAGERETHVLPVGGILTGAHPTLLLTGRLLAPHLVLCFAGRKVPAVGAESIKLGKSVIPHEAPRFCRRLTSPGSYRGGDNVPVALLPLPTLLLCVSQGVYHSGRSHRNGRAREASVCSWTPLQVTGLQSQGKVIPLQTQGCENTEARP